MKVYIITVNFIGFFFVCVLVFVFVFLCRMLINCCVFCVYAIFVYLNKCMFFLESNSSTLVVSCLFH